MAYVYKREGSPFYQAYIEVDGRSRRFSTKSRVRAVAQQIADTREIEENNQLIAQGGITLTEACVAFFREKRIKGKLKKTSEANYRQSLTNIYRVLGDFPLATLTETKVRDYIDERRKAIIAREVERERKRKEIAKKQKKSYEAPHQVPTGDPAIIQDIAFLSSLWSFTRSKDRSFPPNWLKDLDYSDDWGLEQSAKKDSFLLEKEVQRLLDHCLQDYQRLFIILSVDCGMRLRETLRLKWDEIDLDERVITFRGLERTKNGKHRFVPLTERCVNTLQHTKNTQEKEGREQGRKSTQVYVFPNPSGDKPLNSLKTFWKALLERAGMKGVRIHDLRHTFASWASQRGLEDRTVQAILGHSTNSMTARYAHPSKQQLTNAIERFALHTDHHTVGRTKPSHCDEAAVDETAESEENQEDSGAACVTRTRDPIITNDVLYRLS